MKITSFNGGGKTSKIVLMSPKYNHGKLRIILTFTSAFLFLVLSYLVNKDLFRSLDYNSMVGLQNKISRIYDAPLSLFTLLGSTEFTILIILTISFYIIFRKKHLFLGMGLFFLIYLIELAGKLYIYHPKPPNIFYRYALDIKLPSGFIVDTHFSFPSGHMSRITFLVVIVLFLLKSSKMGKRYKFLSVLLISLMFLGVFMSRIYLGEHWFSDVLGGMLLGIFIGSLSLSFW